MASFANVVAQVRQYAPFFASVSGAASYELAESQLNGILPACVIVPVRYAASPQTNLTAVFREVVETYDCLVALDNTVDRAGSASTAVAFDAAFDGLRGALDGWVPLNVDNTSNYLYGFAFQEAEPTTITGAKGFFSFKYSATRIYGTTGSFLENATYLNNLNVVSALNPPLGSTIVVLDPGTGLEIASTTIDLGPPA